jgi:hypothetical protein
MSSQFVGAFNDARTGISLPTIAGAMAQRSGKKARGLSGNLYRLLNTNQTPKRETIVEIADALAELRNLSDEETDQLKERLLRAARPADTQSELRRDLRPRCEEALAEVESLSDDEIASILDTADVATMKLIIAASEKGEGIVPMRFPSSDTVIAAGRARIHVDGHLSHAQKRVLRKAAEMIEAVLQT